MDYRDTCAGCGRDLYNAREIGSSGIYNPGGPDFELCMACFDAEEAIELETGTNFQPDLLQRYYARFGSNRPKLYSVVKGEEV